MPYLFLGACSVRCVLCVWGPLSNYFDCLFYVMLDNFECETRNSPARTYISVLIFVKIVCDQSKKESLAILKGD